MGNTWPWGSKQVNRSKIRDFNDKRLVRFRDFRNVAAGLNESERTRILALNFHDLRAALRNDELLPTNVVRAYAWAIMKASNDFNPVLDVLMSCFDRARELEEIYKEKPKPALYGVPFSVKGNFYLRDQDCTIGFCKSLGVPMTEQCSMVDALEELGAIPMCITNVPQGLMSFTCSNPIYGTTTNPKVAGCVPGGSSGGEACLVAAGGIPFGTGSDLAGSLRIPAAMCGVVSLKPSEHRLVVTGTHGGMPGKCRLTLCFGFFTRTVDEQIELLDLYLNSCAHKRHDNLSVPLPFETHAHKDKKRLKIGYYTNNGFVQPVPACSRVVHEVVDNLLAEGHTVIDFKIPEPELMAELVLKNIMPDGGDYMKDLFKNEIVDVFMRNFVLLLKIPASIRRLASYPLSFFSRQLSTMCRVRLNSASDVRYMQELTDSYMQKFYQEFDDLDAIICPAFPIHAVPHKYPSQLGACAVETALFNMLNMPAGIVPVGHVTPEDMFNVTDEKLYPVGHNPVLRTVRSACANITGAPLAVQVVTMPYQEELCLHVMKEVERLHQKNQALTSPPQKSETIST